MTRIKHTLSFALCVVLIAAMALFTFGCNDETTQDPGAVNESGDVSVTEVGEGETQFYFNVTDKDGNITKFSVKTNKTIVGDALIELGLITGDPGDYGLYVKSVNGITADYNVDGTYWAFYINGEYAMTGVDQTEITAGATYDFKVEK